MHLTHQRWQPREHGAEKKLPADTLGMRQDPRQYTPRNPRQDPRQDTRRDTQQKEPCCPEEFRHRRIYSYQKKCINRKVTQERHFTKNCVTFLVQISQTDRICVTSAGIASPYHVPETLNDFSPL